MQEHGVSKIVSVKFHKSDEQSSGQATVALEGPAEGRSVTPEDLSKRNEPVEVMMAK